MNILDIIIVLFLIAAAITGFKRGVFKETVGFVGTILVILIAFLLKGVVGVWLCKILPFLSYDGVNALNILLYQVVAFILIAIVLFTVLGVVLNVTGVLQKAADMSVVLSLPTKLGGAVVGLLEGFVILFVILYIIAVPMKDKGIFVDSKLNNKILTSTPVLSNAMGKAGDMLFKVYKINVKERTNNAINMELLNMYLKYDIVSKQDLQEIINTGKLDNIKGIEKFK